MTFKDIYKDRIDKGRKAPTPRQAFIAEVADVTKRSRIAVYRWLNGSAVPDALVQEVLAKHFKTTPEELFPPQ